MNVGSLFSGIGGIELGFEREGFETSWFVEYEPYCQEVLKKNFPGVPIYGDITKLNFHKLKKVDVITGGFPCQDISVAGRQAGIKVGKRSSLWKYYKEAIRILRPKVAVIENVPNLLNIGLNVVLADLAQIGYDAEWFCLSASDIGAIHRRERVFIIAYLNSNGFNKGNNTSGDMDTQKRKVQEGKPFGKGWLIKPSSSPPLFITDHWSDRIQRYKQESVSGQQGFKAFQNVRRIEDLKGRPDIPQPLIRGTGNGLPRGMDSYTRTERTKAIGNAVVPQVAQFIARRIKEMNFY